MTQTANGDNLFQAFGSGPHIYNMQAGAKFLPQLASGLQSGLGDQLSQALVLLPTRRAIRELGQVFVTLASENFQGRRRATFLPRMHTLGDMDPSEPPFEPSEISRHIAPAMPHMQRHFELSNLVLAKETHLRGYAPDIAAALSLTQPLMHLLDEASAEQIELGSLDALDDIAQLSASHFQEAASFYKIIQTHWPEHLHQSAMMEPMARRTAVLNRLCDQWIESPPDYPVIIAGSTGTLPATARLMKVVSRLDQGMVVLPGLDQNIRDEIWQNIDDNHPQANLKQLLNRLEVDRKNILIWSDYLEGPGTKYPHRQAREKLISEALIPAESTADWLSRIKLMRDQNPAADPIAQGLNDLSLIEASHDHEEAQIIALAMRHCLEMPGQTAILVTPDPVLGRRVQAALSRWNIEVDRSSGQPLEETSLTVFLSLCVKLALNPWDPLLLAALFKHPLLAMGARVSFWKQKWQALELAAFRGVGPTNFVQLERKFKLRKIAASDRKTYTEMLSVLFSQLAPLTQLANGTHSLRDLAMAHCQVAEGLASSHPNLDEGDQLDGAHRLWRDEPGDEASKLFTDLLVYSDSLSEISLDDYLRLWAHLISERVIRPRFGTHPRLQILGPLEARMIHADLIILGGLNEGVWPSSPPIDSLLSQAMRQKLGLPSLERSYGLAAHDFAQLATQKNVLLTRSQKNNDGPTVASRWIWRLKTLLRGALGSEAAVSLALKPQYPYLDWAKSIDHVVACAVEPAKPARPNPPLNMRWPEQRGGRSLSVTAIENWVRDPYSLFASKILGLRRLDPPGQMIGVREYGSAIHAAMEEFVKNYPRKIEKGAKSWLQSEIEKQLIEAGFEADQLAAENIRAHYLANWIVDWERQRRQMNIYPISCEVPGAVDIEPANGQTFKLIARADRIDRAADGYHIIDYKTGTPPTAKQVLVGFSPQLALEAVIAQEGKFEQLNRGPVDDLVYVKLQGRSGRSETRRMAGKISGETYSAHDLAQIAKEGLLALIDQFDDPKTNYPSQPRALKENTHRYGDFDQLARRAEWASLDSDAPSAGS